MSSGPDELAAWQAGFAAALRQAQMTPSCIEAPGIVARRLALYRGNVIANATRALQAAYPVTQQIVGVAFFDALARAFWREQPATSGDLNEYGAALASFIDGFAPCAQLPYLGDVARLEWAVHRAHFAADAAPFQLAWLAAQPDPERVRLRWHPAATLVETEHPAATIWLAHQNDARATDQEQEQTGAVVTRPRFAVQVQPVDRVMLTWLGALRRDLPLGESIAEALVTDERFDLTQALVRAEAWGVLATCEG